MNGVFRPRDLVLEAAIALMARPSRAALTALGTVLGVAALVATLGIAKTAGGQIISTFNELVATEVVVQARDTGGFGGPRRSVAVIGWDAEAQARQLNGVVSAGTLSDVDVGASLVRSVPIIDPLGQQEFQVPIKATSPGLLDSLRGRLRTGRYFDSGHDERGDLVAVIGPAVAQRLNISRVDTQPALFIGDTAFAVVGIIAENGVLREPSVLSAVLIPNRTAQQLFGLAGPAAVHVDTDVGAAEQVGAEVRVALSPNDPDLLRVQVASNPTSVRERVEDDVNALFVVLGGVSLLVGALGIANVTLVSVLERRAEIGLRRAVGAARRHIAGQFLTESTVLGALGGLVGTSAGILTIVAVSASRGWTPILDLWMLLAAPAAGAAVGLLAGLYPAARAASIEPISALRGVD